MGRFAAWRRRDDPWRPGKGHGDEAGGRRASGTVREAGGPGPRGDAISARGRRRASGGRRGDQRPSRASSDRGATWILRLLGAAVLVLLPIHPASSEVVWCHRVQKGDTLAVIAQRYDLSVAQLRRLNGLGQRTTLRGRRILTLPAIRDLRRGRLDLSRPPLRAAPTRLSRESNAAVRDRLSRMRDLAMVERFRRSRLLVAVPAETTTYYVAGVSALLRVARPWTRYFIEQFSAAFHDLFGERLRITSLTRTRAVQHRLRRANLGAAPALGPVQSTHLTGAAVDISKRSLSASQVAWLRTVLARLHRLGVIHVAEEFREPHFHVMVQRRYRAYGRALVTPVLVGGC